MKSLTVGDMLISKSEFGELKEQLIHVTLFHDGAIKDVYLVKYTAPMWDWCTRVASNKIVERVQEFLEQDGLWAFDPETEYFVTSPVDFLDLGDGMSISSTF